MRRFKNPRGRVVHALIPNTDSTYCDAGWGGYERWLTTKPVTCKTCLRRMKGVSEPEQVRFHSGNHCPRYKDCMYQEHCTCAPGTKVAGDLFSPLHIASTNECVCYVKKVEWYPPESLAPKVKV